MTSAIRIFDEATQKQLFATVDRPQGGTSLADGEIEIFQNRRITTFDSKGLGESYNEIENGEGIHTNNTYFLGVMESSCPVAQRQLQMSIQDAPQVLVNVAPIKEKEGGVSRRKINNL